jgi:hypothetical protein
VSFSNQWRLGRIIPLILAIAFAVDFSARFISLDWLSFRAWEALARYHAPCGPFRANAFYENPLSYGDLAALGNLPQYRQYRREIFSTDTFGFRRNSLLKPPPEKADILVVGDSFIVGTGVNDDETLSAKLERSLGFGVYNGGGHDTDRQDLDYILALAHRLNIRKGTVIYEYYQRHSLPSREYLFGDTTSEGANYSCQDWKTRFFIWYDGFVDTSPLQIFFQRMFKRLQNNSILPNSLRSEVTIKTLKNGEPMLFYSRDFVVSRLERRPIDVSGFSNLAAELRKHNLRLVLLLVPTKYAVYRPLLRDDDTEKVDQSSYLDLVEKTLREFQIPVINLLHPFRKKAQEDYQQGRYIYWRDDTHWNSRGVELAAQEILQQKLTD